MNNIYSFDVKAFKKSQRAKAFKEFAKFVAPYFIGIPLAVVFLYCVCNVLVGLN